MKDVKVDLDKKREGRCEVKNIRSEEVQMLMTISYVHILEKKNFLIKISRQMSI